MRPVSKLYKKLHLGMAALAAGASLAAVSARAQDQAAPSQWPETEASLSYIRNAAAEIERKNGMPFVAIDGTELKKTNDVSALKPLYADTKNPFSSTYRDYLIKVKKDLEDVGPAIAYAGYIPGDRTYLLTAPEVNIKTYLNEFVPLLKESKNFSLDKFLGPLTSDDFVALANYHEMRHTVQETYISSELMDDFASADLGDDARASYKRFLCTENKFESEADSFAALKFVSNTPDVKEASRRIEALKTLAKIRLLSVTTAVADSSDDTYNSLSKTIELIENANDKNWHKVQDQFIEMYRHLYPEKDARQVTQMAKAATRFVAQQGIRNMSDDQYRDLSAFISHAYSPNGEQILGMEMYIFQNLADPGSQTKYEVMKLTVGDTLPEGKTYLAAHLALAGEALRSGRIGTPTSAPAKPRAAMSGVR